MRVNFRSMIADARRAGKGRGGERERSERSERAAAMAAASGMESGAKRSYVQQMFSDIAPSYDRVNSVISFRLDQIWRRKAIRELNVARAPDATYLDLCAGTLDIASQIAKLRDFRGHVVAADFAEPMLRAGLNKIQGRAVEPVTADALNLPLLSDSVAGAIVVFGIRNVVDLDAALSEVYRVLQPGGRFVILEFGVTQPPVIGSLYRLYFNNICPLVGNAISHHHSAYNYLPISVLNFPRESELARRMRAAGFDAVRWRSYTFGVVAIHVGEKRG